MRASPTNARPPGKRRHFTPPAIRKASALNRSLTTFLCSDHGGKDHPDTPPRSTRFNSEVRKIDARHPVERYLRNRIISRSCGACRLFKRRCRVLPQGARFFEKICLLAADKFGIAQCLDALEDTSPGAERHSRMILQLSAFRSLRTPSFTLWAVAANRISLLRVGKIMAQLPVGTG